jgi:hypothetical protein
LENYCSANYSCTGKLPKILFILYMETIGKNKWKSADTTKNIVHIVPENC